MLEELEKTHTHHSDKTEYKDMVKPMTLLFSSAIPKKKLSPFESSVSSLSQVSSHEYQVKVKSSLLLMLLEQVSGPQICDSSLTRVKSCDLSPTPLLHTVQP